LVKKIVCVFLIISYFFVFDFYVKKIGMAWDEPDYLISSQNHFRLIKYFFNDRAKYQKHYFELIDWTNHPALTRWLQGFCYKFIKFYNIPYHNFRLGNLIFLVIFFIASYYLIFKNFGMDVFIYFLILNLINPTFIFYLVCGTLDFPIMAISLFIAAAYFYDTPKKNIYFIFLIFAFCFGLCTKLNSIIIIFICFITSILFEREKLKYLIIALIIGIFSVILFYPFLWHNTLINYKNYLIFHLKHFQAYEYYFFKVYSPNTNPTPFHYPIFYFFVNFAEITVIFSIFGAVWLLLTKQFFNKKIFLILCFAGLSIFLFLRPAIPTYNKTRLFSTALPFLNIIAALFINEIFQKPKKFYPKIIVVIFFVISLFSFVHTHPHIGSHFNIFLKGGGLKQAENFGLQIDTWGESLTLDILEFINKNFRYSARVAIIGHEPKTAYYLQSINLLRRDLNFNIEFIIVNFQDYDYIIALNNKSLWSAEFYQTAKKNILKTDTIEIYEVNKSSK
ncbi:MAG TPA: hypothetical protein PLM75_06010, partial [bacterium]|nr:hypothetical protein [bacterium]